MKLVSDQITARVHFATNALCHRLWSSLHLTCPMPQLSYQIMVQSAPDMYCAIVGKTDYGPVCKQHALCHSWQIRSWSNLHATCTMSQLSQQDTTRCFIHCSLAITSGGLASASDLVQTKHNRWTRLAFDAWRITVKMPCSVDFVCIPALLEPQTVAWQKAQHPHLLTGRRADGLWPSGC